MLQLQVRGPMQLWRSRPQGRLLPLSRRELKRALEETSPPWIQRTLHALEIENRLASPTSTGWSPNWHSFVSELERTAAGSPGYSTAQDIIRFLTNWGAIERSSGETEGQRPLLLRSFQPPQALLVAFRQQFLPHIERVEEQYGQFLRNFEHAYRRRNLRQTFLFGLLITLAFNLPLQRLWREAAALSPQQAMELAERAKALYDKAQADPKSAELAREILRSSVVSSGPSSYRPALNELFGQGPWASLRYMLGSLLTALLVSFGAPFWNDAVGTLARLQKRPEQAAAAEEN